jgi:predicted Fe-S protein YdhL (DUF1289 family)
MNHTTRKAVLSPCVGVCVQDDDAICKGCFRSATEVRNWNNLSNTEKTQVLANTWQRAREKGAVL